MYTPSSVPTDPAMIPSFLTEELKSLSRAIQSQQPYLSLQTLNAPPIKPREGMVVKADGVHWNPGAGAGFYGYKASAWVLLG